VVISMTSDGFVGVIADGHNAGKISCRGLPDGVARLREGCQLRMLSLSVILR
jgi:hypothetical protein